MNEKPAENDRVSQLERKELPTFFNVVLVLGFVPDFIVVNLKKLLDKEKIKGSLAILTNSYHMGRIMKIMENEGLEAEPVTAEDTLLERSRSYRPIVEKYLSSGIMKAKKIKEAILRGLLIIDPAGELPRKITKKLRS